MLAEESKTRRADELIASLYRNAESIRIRELHKAYKKLDANGDELPYQQVFDDLTGSMVKKLLFELTESLKEAALRDDHDLMRCAYRLFRPKGD